MILNIRIVMAMLLVWCTHGTLYLEDFGGVANVDTLQAADKNADALMKAVLYANSSDDRVIEFPDGSVYYLSGVVIDSVMDINFVLNGKIVMQNHIETWNSDATAALYFSNCEGIYFNGNGNGVIDGQGTIWWRVEYIGFSNTRPNIMKYVTCRDIAISNILFLTSPRYSIQMDDCADAVIHDVTIYIDPHIKRGLDRHDSVTYALNTDGIDLAAFNVTVYNCNITNYDDAIVPKPCRSTGKYCQCAGDILAYNNTIRYSTGLAIGSVPPHVDTNCIRNVTFRDTYMYRPLKAIYIKSNPGNQGTGVIEDITFQNIFIEQALWWTIYIGPQQQNQPGGDDGTGCNFLLPFIPVCPTQPLVTISRITLRNVTAIDTLPSFEGPGVILCDALSPCTDLVFEDVTNTVTTANMSDILEQIKLLPVPYVPGVVFPTAYRSDDWKYEYLTTNARGVSRGVVDPPMCFDKSCEWDGSAKH